LAVSWYDPLAGTYTDDAQRVGGGIQSFASPLASAMVVLKIARLDGVVVNPAPTATGLSPSDAVVGGAAFTLTVSGSNFLEESVVRWNGTARPTTFVSDTLVTAAIGVTDIATMGSAAVTVFNPGPGGGNSNALAFAITGNPVPTVAGLSPGSAAAGGAAFTLTVNGSNFIQGAKVRWKGLDRPTAYENASRLTASIPSEDIVEAGPAAVTVFNPGPGGGTSNAMTFTVAEPNPVPTATNLSPGSATAGGAAFTLTVNGSNFTQGSKVQWMGVDKPTSFVNPTRLTAAISMADIAAAGPAAVTVFNPTPGGGTSNTLTFTVASGPALKVNATSVAPGTAVTVTLEGGLGGARDWLGLAAVASANTSYLTWTYVGTGVTTRTWTVTVAAGTWEFRLFQNDGYTRLATSPTVTAMGNPTASSLSPASAAPGGGNFTLTVTGSNFTPSSVVRWKGVDKPTSYVNATRVTAAIPAADIAVAGPAAVTVFNPAPGGGTSNALTFSVVAGPTLRVNATSVTPGTAVTVTLEGGPGGSTAWLSLAAAGSPNASYVTWTYVGAGVATRTWTVTVGAGTWEFRLFVDSGFTRMATSPTITAAGTAVPSASTLSPTRTAPGGSNFTLAVTGSNFIPTSVVRWKGVDKPTSYVNANQVTATILPADIAAAGSAAVTVFNPGPGGGTSNALTFTVAAVPTLRVSATRVTPGTAVTVTLEGGLGGAKDWLGLAAVGSANTSYVAWTYVGTGVTTRTWAVTLAAGTWEFRLFQNDGYTRLATSPTVTAAP
jgi:alpha-D-ribose 1-methylphosphonate 5-triphosphate synthase subunit PhnH